MCVVGVLTSPVGPSAVESSTPPPPSISISKAPKMVGHLFMTNHGEDGVFFLSVVMERPCIPAPTSHGGGGNHGPGSVNASHKGDPEQNTKEEKKMSDSRRSFLKGPYAFLLPESWREETTN